jgi:hypothetical protein
VSSEKGINMQVRDLQAEARKRLQPLEEAAATLREAVAAPEADRFDKLAGALVRASTALALHVALTEGPEGTHAELLAAAPRLSNDIRLLAKDHAFMECLIETTGLALQTDTPDQQAVGEHVNRLLERIARHRLRDTEMVYEAYQVDIGGQA